MTNARPLLSELHAHTTWSDGVFTPDELVDLYGLAGFDVLAITDHTFPECLPDARGVRESDFPAYLHEVERVARRAWTRYELLVLPGLELTAHDDDPARSAHALALGLRDYVAPDDLPAALASAREHGAALVAAHPHGATLDRNPNRTTQRWWHDREALAPLVDRFELVNRHDVFGWVAEARLPAIASGDFHRLEHLATWKTLLPCDKTERSVLAVLRSPQAAWLMRLDEVATPAELAA